MNLESALQDWTRRQAFFCYIDASNWSITILCPWCANAALALGGNQVLEISEIKSCHSRHLTTSRTCQHCALTVSMRAWPRANGDLKASEAVSTNDDVHCFLCIVSFSGSMPFTYVRLYLYSSTSRAARGGGGSFKNRKCIGGIGCCESRMTKRKHWWIWLTAALSNWLTD